MVLERLREFIDSKGITIAAFEKSVGMANASLRKTLASGAGIGTDKLEKIRSFLQSGCFAEKVPC